MRIFQPNLINRIIEAVLGMEKANEKTILMSPTLVMTKFINGNER